MGGEPFTVLEIRLMRQVSGFGFRIIGGKEEGSQVSSVYCAWKDVVNQVMYLSMNDSLVHDDYCCRLVLLFWVLTILVCVCLSFK